MFRSTTLPAQGGQRGTVTREPMTGFHLRVTATTFGANFSDGYALGVIGAVMTILTASMNLSGVWQGLLGASALIGLFFGSISMGWVADRIGRQKLYVANFSLITLASAAQYWAHGPLTLFALRVLIGIGLGADYAVGPTLLSEFAPRRLRGVLLGSLTVLWTVGYVIANILGTYVSLDDHSAHLLLASGALPAALVLVLRLGTPESPSWLVSQGRIEQAQRISRDYLRTELAVAPREETTEHTETRSSYRELFAKGQAGKTWFGALFYSAQVLPYFAIYTFMTTILDAMHVSDTNTQNTLLNVFLLLGGVIGLWPVQKMGRRPFTLYTFIIMTACLGVMAVYNTSTSIWIMAAFWVYTFVMSAASNITQVYPPELFPTRLRGSGVGFLNGFSRIASALGTFVLPVALNDYGLGWSIGGLALVLALGALITFLWAPETKDTVTKDAWVH